MAKTSVKSIHNTDLKNRLPVAECMYCAQQIEENLHMLENVNLSGATAVAAGCREMAQQFGHVCSNAITCYVQMVSHSLNQVCHMGEHIIEHQHKTAHELLSISRQAMECRSADEFYNVQRVTASTLIRYWFDSISEVVPAAFPVPIRRCILPLD